MLANGNTYEIMAPNDVGRSTEIVLTRHSGRHAVKAQLQLLGYQLGDNSFASIFAAFQTLAEVQKRVTDEDLKTIVKRVKAA